MVVSGPISPGAVSDLCAIDLNSILSLPALACCLHSYIDHFLHKGNMFVFLVLDTTLLSWSSCSGCIILCLAQLQAHQLPSSTSGVFQGPCPSCSFCNPVHFSSISLLFPVPLLFWVFAQTHMRGPSPFPGYFPHSISHQPGSLCVDCQFLLTGQQPRWEREKSVGAWLVLSYYFLEEWMIFSSLEWVIVSLLLGIYSEKSFSESTWVFHFIGV